jgi:hypothetical protein
MEDFLYFLVELLGESLGELLLAVFEALGSHAIRVLCELRDPRPAKYPGPFGHFGRPFST